MQNIKASVPARYLALVGSFILLIILYYMEVSLLSTLSAVFSKVLLYLADGLYYSGIAAVSIFHHCVGHLRRNLCVYVTLSKPSRTTTSTLRNKQYSYENRHPIGIFGTTFTPRNRRKYSNGLMPPIL